MRRQLLLLIERFERMIGGLMISGPFFMGLAGLPLVTRRKPAVNAM
jgi:hypothetical protein